MNSGVNHGMVLCYFASRVCAQISLGTFLHIAHEDGLILNTSVHAGIRAPLIRPKDDLRNDLRCGFEIVTARDLDRLGVAGVLEKLRDRVGKTKVYVSVDIDVLDPAFAPGKLLQIPSLGVGHLPGLLHMYIICIRTGGWSDNAAELTPIPEESWWLWSRTARYTQYVHIIVNEISLVLE